jgi:hypothetical protein
MFDQTSLTALPVSLPLLDHDDFRLIQSKIMNSDRFLSFGAG